MYLLDTNIVIELFAKIPDTITLIDSLKGVCCCDIVLGELYYGAYNSKQRDANLQNIERFTSLFPITSADHATANIYGQLKQGLKSIGKPAPDNDIWIAAIAKQNDFSIVTRDHHFLNMAGVKVIDTKN
jgi:tRNA(fMet)-specific endonuclease VapC